MTVISRIIHATIIAAMLAGTTTIATAQTRSENPDTLLWGDVHLHTNLSWDAYYMGNRTADVETAFRFAKGAPVVHPFHRAKVRIDRPLDFLAVTDHAEFLGLPYSAISGGDPRMTATRLGEYLKGIYDEGGPGATALVSMIVALQTSAQTRIDTGEENAATSFPPPPPQVTQDYVDWIMENPDIWDEFFNPDVMKSNWDTITRATDAHNDPGKFTTLVGWEWSAQANGGNLHRVVLSPMSGKTARSFKPFSFLDDDDPEGLWVWLEDTRRSTGEDFVAIPHNSNLSKGSMFARTRRNGEPIDAAYATRRAQWETIVEVTQMKGDSETHPLLSPTDEFADFEFFAHELASFKDDIKVPPVTESDYVRPALKTGLEMEASLGVNPFKLGMIGSTDGHNAMSSTEESNFYGKFGEGTTPETAPLPVGDFSGYTNWDFSASGLAAVWAKENTREEVFAAFRRREVYGTTGPRIKLRFFGGYDFTQSDLKARNLADVGYAKGVPMGADLLPATPRRYFRRNQTPSFLVQAAKDPVGANLDRVQIVKGWLDADGSSHETVYDVAWSGMDRVGQNGKLEPIGDTVDSDLVRYTNDIGTDELLTVWIDPDFKADQSAFYYVRVLEIPTPRQSTYDAAALGVEPSKTHPAAIQERAYSSPIWYRPTQK